MKKIVKIIGVGLGVLVLLVVGYGIVKNEPLPEGKSGSEADALAQKMLNALNAQAYENTRYLEWSYQGGKNQYRWDKLQGQCRVKWDEYVVELNLVQPEKSMASQNQVALKGDVKSEVVAKALANFNNDSFWLVAPYKVFDSGTSRSLVPLENGTQGLLVTYSTGGTTPGDSYLWQLNEKGIPESYKMWVKIIPIGGINASWDNWMITESGAYLPTSHKLGPLELSMGTVKGYN